MLDSTPGRDQPACSRLDDETNTLLYLCYGAGPHVEETIFSLLTAFSFLPPETPGYRYVVYTDIPKRFIDMGVVIRPLAATELEAWLGGSDYIHRRKTMAIIDALERYPGSLAFIDCDTYFRRSPALLFDRIGPGRSCLHVLEARLLESRTEFDKTLSDAISRIEFFDRAGRPLAISPNAPMWNSGVVGIHSADIDLMREVLDVTDQMWRQVKVHHIEQFLAGYFLARNKLSKCPDIVFHYWPGYMRKPFRKKLPDLLAQDAKLPLAARAKRAYESRPRPPVLRAIEARVRRTLRYFGVPVPGMIKSA